MSESKKQRIEDSYDVVVIGAGNGGLAATAFLAKQGIKVLCLEQHNLPGGDLSRPTLERKWMLICHLELKISSILSKRRCQAVKSP